MNIPAFITGTVIIIAFSWLYSVKHGRFHGIPRFFAFESIYILLLLNIKLWFRDPFSVIQVFSWILLCLSAYVGLAGYLHLKNHGEAENGFENTTKLVISGIYSYIRHPLYCSLILLGTGIALKDPVLYKILLGAVNIAALWLTAKTEEKEMIDKFGNDYRKYMQKTKMFIPFII
ncbi:MAG: methyltransferase family protein [Bacteroidales bacterium]|jgi:protein-S-isoprenylcysteine O-methyltransferase Ste14